MKNNIINSYCSKNKRSRDQLWFRFPRLRPDMDRLEKGMEAMCSGHWGNPLKKSKNIQSKKYLKS